MIRLLKEQIVVLYEDLPADFFEKLTEVTRDRGVLLVPYEKGRSGHLLFSQNTDKKDQIGHVILVAKDFSQTLGMADDLVLVDISCELLGKKIDHLFAYLEVGKNHEFLELVLDRVDNGIVITDHDGKIEYANKSFLNATGYEAEELLGENPRTIKSEEHPPSYYEDLWKTITAGNIWKGDFVNKSKHGSLIYEEAIISPIFLEDGGVGKYVKVSKNITKDKFFENQLKLNASLAIELITHLLPKKTKDEDLFMDFFVRQMNELGGDHIWFERLSEDQVYLAIIDVTGHDLSSALMVMTLAHIIKGFADHKNLTQTIQAMNDYLCEYNLKSDGFMLATGILAHLDLKKKHLTYVNAGHQAGLLGGQPLLSVTMPILGAIDHVDCRTGEVALPDQGDLFLYSDGAEDYVLACLNEEKEVATIYEGIKKHFSVRGSQEDDVSALYLKIT